MTDDDLEVTSENAQTFIIAVGGVLGLILGLRAGDTQVSWDPDQASFVIGDRIVSIETIRDQLLRIEVYAGNRLAKLAEDLGDGIITLEEWLDEMKGVVVSFHIASAALAAGGVSLAIRLPGLADRIQEEIDYADLFATDIAKNNPSTRYIAARSKSYMLAAVVTFSVVEQTVKAAANVGRGLCRRVRRASESCQGCIDWSYKWIPISQMPAIGSLQCRSRCRCFLEYR